jgi:hypothetical protein
VAGTFDSAARAVGLLPHRLAADQAADMTVTQGGETHGEELRHVERNAALMDDAGVRHVLITDDGTGVGVVCVRDVLPVLLRGLR